MDNTDFYYEEEDGFGWKRISIEKQINSEKEIDRLFTKLESLFENSGKAKSLLPGIFICVVIFSIFGFSKTTHASELVKLKSKQVSTYTLPTLPTPLPTLPTPLPTPLQEVVKRKKGHRLGHYYESLGGQMILEVFAETKKQSMKNKNVFLKPSIFGNSALIEKASFFPERKSYQLNLLNKSWVQKPQIEQVQNSFFSLTGFLSISGCLIVCPWWIPVPPGFRSIVKTIVHAFRILETTKKKPVVSEENGRLDFFTKIVSVLPSPIPRNERKTNGLAENFSFLPGTILFIIIGVFKRKNFDAMLESAGFLPKLTRWQKFKNSILPWVNPTKTRFYFVLGAGGIIFVYFNREKLVAQFGETNPVSLSFRYLNKFLDEYKSLVGSTVLSAQQATSEAYKKLWLYTDRDRSDLTLIRSELSVLRNENKQLSDEMYRILRISDNNFISAKSCVKELSNNQMEVVRLTRVVSTFPDSKSELLSSANRGMSQEETSDIYNRLIEHNLEQFPLENNVPRIIHSETVSTGKDIVVVPDHKIGPEIQTAFQFFITNLIQNTQT